MAALRLCWTRAGLPRWWAMAYDLLAANSFKRPQSCIALLKLDARARECASVVRH